MTDTKPSSKNRRTDLEIQEAVSFALQHIELGMSRTTVQQMLCSKFCYPMKTARRDYLLAMDEYGSAGITPIAPMEKRDDCLAMCQGAMIQAYTEGEHRMVAALSKEIRELLKMGGPGAARSPRDAHIEQEPSAIAREAYFAKHSCDLQR
jgi:hypothetical protein